jgi:hypothetical protein
MERSQTFMGRSCKRSGTVNGCDAERQERLETFEQGRRDAGTQGRRDAVTPRNE